MRRTISNPQIAAILIKIADFCWISIPRGAARLSCTAGALMSNGVWLCAWTPAGALAAPATLLMGLLLTWTIQSGQTFTSSMTVMALMLGVACLGTALGVWVWLGYVLADTFLVAHPLPHYARFEWLIRVRGSLLVSYLLLAALLIGIPLAAQAFSALIVSGLRRGSPRKIIVSILQPLLQGAMVYSWAQAAPILIAPVFTWKNVTPPTATTAPLHDWGWILAPLAVLICAARLFAVSWAVAHLEVKQRTVQLKRALAALPPPKAWPVWAAAITRASLMSLMLAALFDGWLVAGTSWMFLALLGIAQADWIGQLRRWTRVVSYLPVIVRLLLGLALGVALSRPILKHSHPDLSYRPLLLCLAVTMTAIALLLPKLAEANQTQGAALPLSGGAKLNVSGVTAAND
jgi:hypothetical protein